MLATYANTISTIISFDVTNIPSQAAFPYSEESVFNIKYVTSVPTEGTFCKK